MVTSVFLGITDLEPELGNSGLPKCTPFFYCENLTFPKKHDLLLREKTTHISEQQAQNVIVNSFHLDNTSRVLSKYCIICIYFMSVCITLQHKWIRTSPADIYTNRQVKTVLIDLFFSPSKRRTDDTRHYPSLSLYSNPHHIHHLSTPFCPLSSIITNHLLLTSPHHEPFPW